MAAEWTTPDSVHSKCGETAGYEATKAIDDNDGTAWNHLVVCYHWIIFDMGKTKKITKIRLSQAYLAAHRWGKTDGLYVYVSDDVENWGDPVWEGVLQPNGWIETDAFEKDGRYIKLVSKSNASDQYMYEFDAMAETIPIEHKVTVAEVLGMVNGVSKKAAYKKAVAEKLGMVDSVKKAKGVHVTVAEKLGLKDDVSKKAAYKKTVAEKLGLVDAVKKVKAVHVTVAEKLGMVDDYFKRVTMGKLPDNPDNVGSRGSPIYGDMPDYLGAVYVNTKNTWQDAENLDDAHGYTSYIWIPEETFKVKLLKLHVYAEKFRAYSKAAAAGGAQTKTSTEGGAHSHSVSGVTSSYTTPSHTHTVSIGVKTSVSGGAHKHCMFNYNPLIETEPARGFDCHDQNENNVGIIMYSQYALHLYTYETVAAHTHNVDIGAPTSESGGASHAHTVSGQTAVAVAAHQHSVTIDDHTHEITYGIYEEEITDRTLKAKLYDPKDNLLKDFDVITTGEEDVILDLTDYFKDLKYGMYRLELTASNRIRARLVYYELGIMFAV